MRELDEEEEGADLDAGVEDDEYVPLTPGGGLAPKKPWQLLTPGAPFRRNTAPDAPPLRQQLKNQARPLYTTPIFLHRHALCVNSRAH